MPTVSNVSKPAYVYDAGTDAWIPVGVGVHTHDTSSLVSVNNHFAAGKNKIINGDFGIWQRGTSFTADGYTADRWMFFRGNTTTLSRQTFTPGTAPVAGYEGTYFCRLARTAGSSNDYLTQRIEDIRTFANQTVTVSFWAKADSATSISEIYFGFNTGSGGSTAPIGVGKFTATDITTSWSRYSVNITVPSLSGVTIGTSSFIELTFKLAAAVGNRTIDFWGVQVEAGSAATPFTTATGTLQGELAACQRYYYRSGGSSTYEVFGWGIAASTTALYIQTKAPVTMRIAPTAVDYSTLTFVDQVGGSFAVSTLGLNMAGKDITQLYCTVASGLTQFRSYYLAANNSTSAYLGFSAEL